mgnify:CR=1 FL=1
MVHDCVLALGFFDGIHLGHAALLDRTRQRAQALGLTPAALSFDTHPDTLVFGTAVPLLNTMAERELLMRRLCGMERVIFAHFDEAMMHMPWQVFVEDYLVRQLHAKHVVCGHDFHFGDRGQGDPARLQEKCRELGIGCDIIPKVELEGVTVSSTYIRTLVEAGDVERAALFLGHRHCLTQTVVHGHRLGRTLGIPTVNLTFPPHVLAPRRGVYITRVYLPDGTSLAGVTNVGTRPTVSDGTAVSVETFLLDFDGDLYGKCIRVEFCCRLRDEQKFDSLEALKAQIRENIRQTRDYFAAESTRG